MATLSQRERSFAWAFGLMSFLCLGLFGFRVLLTGSNRYYFIPGNLALAWISLGVIVYLIKRLKTTRWQSWQNVFLTLIWLLFLPNAWYVLTDFIHVYPNGEISQLYDIALISSLVFCGFGLGLAGLYLFHKEMRKRFSRVKSFWILESVILLSSFAVFLGRDLRWNSWDVIANPAGVIVNVSNQVIDPLGNSRGFNVTVIFFVFISFLYWSIWKIFGSNQSRSDRSN